MLTPNTGNQLRRADSAEAIGAAAIASEEIFAATNGRSFRLTQTFLGQSPTKTNSKFISNKIISGSVVLLYLLE